MLSVWLALIPVAIGCFRYFFSPTRQAIELIRQRVVNTGDRKLGNSFTATGESPKSIPERLLSAGSLCEQSAIPAFLKSAYSASYSIDTLLSENDSESDLSTEGCDGISSPPGLTTTDGDVNLHLAEELLRAVVPADVETVLSLAWLPPGESIWLEEFPGLGHHSTPRQHDVERELLTSLSLDRCRDSAREMISPQCGSWWVEQSGAGRAVHGGRTTAVRTRARAPLSPWESPRGHELAAREIQELDEELNVESCADRTSLTNLQSRLNGTINGTVRRLDRDILLMHPIVVVDTLVAVILGDSSTGWHRTAAADVLCWFSLHPNVSLRSDIRRRVVEGVVSAALGETQAIKRTGLRALRNLLDEDCGNKYVEAFVEDMYFPWVLSLTVDPESVVYLHEILCLVEERTGRSISLLIGANAMVATRKNLSFLCDLVSDDRALAAGVQEYLVPCALSSIMRYMSTDVIEELCAGDDTGLGVLMHAIGDCASTDGPFPQEIAVAMIEKMLLCSDSSPMKETIYKSVVTKGGVNSLFEALKSGTESYELAAINVLHRIHSWDSMLLASLISADENKQLGRVLCEGLAAQKRLMLSLIQKVWYQRMSTIESGLVRKIVGLIDDNDPKVRDVAVCTLASLVLTESPQKEISHVVVRNLVHLKAIMVSRNPRGVNHQLVADLLMRFLEGSDRVIQVSTLCMIRDILPELNMAKRINKRLLASASQIFLTLFRKEDSELARVLLDMCAEAGHRRPDVVAETILENVPETGHVWDLFDHMHRELSIETLQGFGRVLWQLRNLELKDRST